MTGQPCCAGCAQGKPGCGCRAGRQPQTPVTIANPPGQQAIAYRAGDYGTFLSSMLARLGSSAYPALAKLTVRDPSDPAIALLDGWAAVADLLTFYTERLASEGYLRTATDPASLRLLGALAGYRPRPGVAASTYLSFTVHPSGSDTTVTIPGGTRALSSPAPGQGAQAFESVTDMVGRSSWNDLSVRTRRPAQISPAGLPNMPQVTLAGSVTTLSPGNRMLFVFGAEPGMQRLWVVSRVAVDQAAGVTVVGQAPSALPTLDRIKADYEALLADPAIDLSGMDTRSRIVSRFADAWLTPLTEHLGQITTPEDLAARLDAVLQGLDDSAALAERYPAIYSWFTGTLRPALASLRAELTPLLHAPGPDAGTGGGQPGQGSLTDPALRALAAVLPALRRPPGRPRRARRRWPPTRPSGSRRARRPGRICSPRSTRGCAGRCIRHGGKRSSHGRQRCRKYRHCG